MIDRFRSQWGPCLDDFNYNPFRPAPDHTAAMQLGPDGTLTLSPVDPSGYSADGTPVPPWTTLTTPLQEDQDEVTGFRGDAITFHFVGGQWYPDTVASYVLGGSTCDLSTPSGNPTPYPAP
ncbi:MAG TPA: hypothetical protein VLF69_01705 [Candidatus Saccharimonadales bacterium]|nr:hypothetical protein [Candidatus Saccharimonadales bacterium]